MNQREAKKLKKGDKFRRKPHAVWNREGLFPTIYTVDYVAYIPLYSEVVIIAESGERFTNKEICLP